MTNQQLTDESFAAHHRQFGDERDQFKDKAAYSAYLRERRRKHEDICKQCDALQVKYDALPPARDPYDGHHLPEGRALEEELDYLADRIGDHEFLEAFRAYCERIAPDAEYWAKRKVDKPKGRGR